MFQTISDYWTLISEFTNPVKIIFSAIGSTIVAFLVIVLAMILLRKIILIKRRHILLRILSISYFVLIPILTLFFGFKWGLVDGIHSDLKEHLPAYTKGLNNVYNKNVAVSLQSLVTGGKADSTVKISTNDVIDTLSVVLYRNYGDLLYQEVNSHKGDMTGKVAGVFLKLFKEDGISYAIKKGLVKLVEKSIGVDEEVTKEVMNVKINELLEKGVITKIVEIQLDKVFKGIKRGIIIMYCMILLLPVAEIAIAYWLFKKAATPLPEQDPRSTPL